MTSALERARAESALAVELRRRIHAAPELGLELPNTKRAVLAALDALPLEIREHAGSSGFVARLRGGRPGPALLLRADMDALPLDEDADVAFRSRIRGAMHACGHDAHTAMLVGAARALAAERESLSGEVHFMFQAGEEKHFGARRMLEDGLLDADPPLAGAFAIHIEPRLPVGWIATRAGPLLASTDDFEIALCGRGGHASMPHDAADPIPVACELVIAAQSWVSRHIPAFEPVVLTFAQIEAGTTFNVIPERAVLRGTLRSVSARSRELARAGLRQLAEGIASAHGLKAEFALDEGYPVTVNDAGFVGFLREALPPLLGPDRWIEMPHPVMGGEDFSYVIERTPGAMIFLGARIAEGDAAPCHSNRMRLNEDALALGIAIHVTVARGFLA
jgi:amidohydrolase